MLPTYFAATEAAETGGILGFDAQTFLIQIVTFVLVFVLLKKFAFNKIVAILNDRHKVIDEGVRHGQQMKREREKFESDIANTARDARHQADKIIGEAQKDAREIIRDAEKAAHKKSEIMLADAKDRLKEEVKQAKRNLEKDVANLVSEATEAVVEEKIDAKKDAELIERAIKKGRK